MQNIKRLFVKTCVLLPVTALLGACKATAMGQRPQLSPAQQRMDGMGLTLVVDAVQGAEMLGVEFFADERDFPFFAHSRVTKRNRGIMAFPSGVVPERVRVLWRVDLGRAPSWWGLSNFSDDLGKPLPESEQIRIQHDDHLRKLFNSHAFRIERRKLIARNLGYEHQGPWSGQYFGAAAGDYTFPVASRIPDEVIHEIRKNGGGLRLKFRLKPDGVLFGWDIERFSGGLPRHSMPGGDFLETWY